MQSPLAGSFLELKFRILFWGALHGTLGAPRAVFEAMSFTQYEASRRLVARAEHSEFFFEALHGTLDIFRVDF